MPILEDVASIQRITAPAQVNRKGPNRYVTIVANIYDKDLGTASRAVRKAIEDAGEPPRGTVVWTEGTLQLLEETLHSLLAGLAVAVMAIFLMLSSYYQSFKVPGDPIGTSVCYCRESHHLVRFRKYAQFTVIYGNYNVCRGFCFQCRIAG